MHSEPNIIPGATVLSEHIGAILTVRYLQVMRTVLLALPLLVVPLPAMAWEFTPVPICTLFHQDPEVSVRVTYDPASGEYAIHLSREGGWPDAAVFSLRFEGPRGLTISTTRHVIEVGDTRTLTVRDRGFGNVLNGLEFNTRAVAILGDLEVPVMLDGAAPAVEEFRACPAEQLAMSTRRGPVRVR